MPGLACYPLPYGGFDVSAPYVCSYFSSFRGKASEQQAALRMLLHQRALFNQARTADVDDGDGAFGYGSGESEYDLDAMVHDFMENGSYSSEPLESSDGENRPVKWSKLIDALQTFKYNSSPFEKELLSTLSVLAFSIREMDLVCLPSKVECRGGCIRWSIVKHLQGLGFNAAVCTSKWPNSGKVPGGEYEYIEAIFEEQGSSPCRLIVDADFRSQFEIARPTHFYTTALELLPGIFVGSEAKLQQVLQIMAEAGKLSLRQNLMPVPPWRTFNYMMAKWMSPCERKLVDEQGAIPSEEVRTRQCIEHLRHLKINAHAECDRGHMLASADDQYRNWKHPFSDKSYYCRAPSGEPSNAWNAA